MNADFTGNRNYTPVQDRPEVLSGELIPLNVWAEKNPEVIASPRMASRYVAQGRVPGVVRMSGVTPLTYLVPENSYLLAPDEDKQPPRDIPAIHFTDWRKKNGLRKNRGDALIQGGYIPLLEYGFGKRTPEHLMPADFPVPSYDIVMQAIMDAPELRTATDIVEYGLYIESLRPYEIAEKYNLPRPTTAELASRIRRRMREKKNDSRED